MILKILQNILKTISKLDTGKGKTFSKLILGLLITLTALYVIFTIIYLFVLILTSFKKYKCESSAKVFTLIFFMVLTLDFIFGKYLHKNYSNKLLYKVYSYFIVVFIFFGIFFQIYSEHKFVEDLEKCEETVEDLKIKSFANIHLIYQYFYIILLYITILTIFLLDL